MQWNIGIHGLSVNWNLFLSYETIVIVFAVQFSMLLNVIEHKYSWSKCQLDLI